jgi:molybdenum cofactor cytidylyltransferase
MKIIAILLAAGGSSRLGSSKQFLEFKGEPLLRRSLRALLGSHVQRVMTVLGANHDCCRAHIDDLPVECVLNTRWRDGISGSIALGLEAALRAEPHLDAVVIALCDQPHMTTRLINEIIAVHHETGAGKIASVYENVQGAPALFSKAHFLDLLSLKGDEGARSLLRADDVALVSFPKGSVDIDTPEQYQALVEMG